MMGWRRLAVVATFLGSAHAFVPFTQRQRQRRQRQQQQQQRQQRQQRQHFVTREKLEDEVDIAIVGAGIGGLCAGAILNTLYNKTVAVYESHYLPGGCAHAFRKKSPDGRTFTFDSGPTIVLGCSAPPYNPLRQILNVVGQQVEWIPYDGWGMIEQPHLAWKVKLGPKHLEEGPMERFGGDKAREEFSALRQQTRGLVESASTIPAMAMRAGRFEALVPLLRYLPQLWNLIRLGEDVTRGTFGPYMDGPLFRVTDPWLRAWLDALAFSLSGLPAARTSAGAMAYVLFDMHREGTSLDYPRGGLGAVVDALVRALDGRSKLHLRQHVETIDTTPDGRSVVGLTLRGGKRVRAREGVICNAPVWTLRQLIQNPQARNILLNNNDNNNNNNKPKQTWNRNNNTIEHLRTRPPSSPQDDDDSLLHRCDTAEQTGSFLHLHLAIRSDGLDLDKMEAHYTVMDRSLFGDGSPGDGPWGEQNMIAVSNPSVIDDTLAPEGTMVVHAYAAGNEPYHIWEDVPEYKKLKEKRAEVLWRAVESIIPDVRERVILEFVGSPKTHEFFLRRPRGTYGSATEDYLPDGSTPIRKLTLAGDGVFPGIGVPAVALSGASAANAMVSLADHWKCLDELDRRGVL